MIPKREARIPSFALLKVHKGVKMELRNEIINCIGKKEGYSTAKEMIRKLSSEAEGFCFDKSFDHSFGNVVTDGFMEQDDRYVFVYAICDEPYAEMRCELNFAYRELYQFLNERMYGSVECYMEDESVSFGSYGEKVCRFDLKNVIEYMLGIAFSLLTGAIESKNIDLMYLAYDPDELGVSDSTREQAVSIYEKLCEECNELDLSTLFTVITLYLRDIKGVGKMSDEELELLGYNFTVYMCNQELYPNLLV